MTPTVRVLAIAGSLRQASLNHKLLRCGIAALQRHGAEVAEFDLHAVSIPMYDQDIEDAEGLPSGVLELKRRIAEVDGLLFAVPEYNSSVPGGFKNVLDWTSRGTEDVLRGKVGAIMSASPGGFGGIRMNSHLRQIMRALGILTIYDQVTVSRAHEAFHEDGSLVSPHLANQVETLAAALIEECQMRKLRTELLAKSKEA
ncbi:FMN-dependent NADPH-azoreductase [compost metagenome]